MNKYVLLDFAWSNEEYLSFIRRTWRQEKNNYNSESFREKTDNYLLSIKKYNLLFTESKALARHTYGPPIYCITCNNKSWI